MSSLNLACIVNHDPFSRATLHTRLASAGIATLAVTEIGAAINAIKRTSVDLAMVNMVTVPIGRIRMVFPDLWIVATSSGHQRYLELAPELGANDTFVWPYLAKHLDQILTRLRSRNGNLG